MGNTPTACGSEIGLHFLYNFQTRPRIEKCEHFLQQLDLDPNSRFVLLTSQSSTQERVLELNL